MLYHIHLLTTLGEHQRALDVLNSNSEFILDKTQFLQYRANLLTALDSSEAAEAWHALISRNSDCKAYYDGYLKAKNAEEPLSTIDALASEFPRASVPLRLALTLSSGEDFESRVEAYLKNGLEKGIPSLFSDLKSLYSDVSKRDAVAKVAQGLKEKVKEDPSTYLWTLYYLAQHFSFLGEQKQALEIVEQAISHTPTLPDLYTLKGRILKRAGDLLGAASAVNEARLLDGQDRFLNTKTGKYLLRAGLVDEASNILGLFTKVCSISLTRLSANPSQKDAASPGADLEEMQSLLYLLEAARGHEKNGKLNLALKKYMAVKKIYDDIEDDQYDFHGYNLRKFTLNAYLSCVYFPIFSAVAKGLPQFA